MFLKAAAPISASCSSGNKRNCERPRGDVAQELTTARPASTSASLWKIPSDSRIPASITRNITTSFTSLQQQSKAMFVPLVKKLKRSRRLRRGPDMSLAPPMAISRVSTLIAITCKKEAPLVKVAGAKPWQFSRTGFLAEACRDEYQREQGSREIVVAWNLQIYRVW
jgi:hypothetical protein